MHPYKANRRRNYTPAPATARAADPVGNMVEFMLSEAGNYSGHAHVAALSALDHARDYAEGEVKNAFWYCVYCRLELASLDLISIDKIGG